MKRNTLPSFTGLQLGDAKRRALAAGLDVAVTVVDASAPKLQVVAQQPPAGAVEHDGRVLLHVAMPSWLRHLPEVFEEGDVARNGFLRRFLQLSQHLLLPVEERLAGATASLDPLRAPSSGLPWLASWLSLPMHDDWSEQRRRRVLARAPELWSRRGTPAGLRLALELLADVRATIVEAPPAFAAFRAGHRSRIGVEGSVCWPVPDRHWFQVLVDEALDPKRLALAHAVVASHAPAQARWVIHRRATRLAASAPGFLIGSDAVGRPSRRTPVAKAG